MVKCCVFFEVRTEFLNKNQTSSDFKGLIQYHKIVYVFGGIDTGRFWFTVEIPFRKRFSLSLYFPRLLSSSNFQSMKIRM
jgi:hypothetical protein